MTHQGKMPLFVGLGEILWDILPTGKELGGAPANFAYHARALGATAMVISAVGEDEMGREIRRRLDTLGVNGEFVAKDAIHPTGSVSVRVDARGNPAYIIHENTAWDFIPFQLGMEALAGRVDVVCFGSLGQRSPVSKATIQRFVQATGPGCKRIFDINLRQNFYNQTIIEEALRLSNILKLNADELPVLAEMFALRGGVAGQLAELLERFELELIALTRGEKGAILKTLQESSECAGFPAVVVDTVGAGDAFTAALIRGLLAGRTLDTVNRQACQVASYVCSQRGATPPISAEIAAQFQDVDGG